MSTILKDHEAINKEGYFIAPHILCSFAIDRFLNNFCKLVIQESKHKYTSAFDDNLCTYLTTNRAFQSHIYEAIRKTSFLKEFISQSGLLNYIKKHFHPAGSYLLEKLILRIDQPYEISELAIWHQDFYYVKGNTEVITAWIPLQDVTYVNGCLSIMPRSHLLGPLPHTKDLLKKKFIPEGIYQNEIRYVEMKKGDCLFFHSLLLHSGNLNLSSQTRYSIQARFSPVGLELPPEMGQAFLI